MSKFLKKTPSNGPTRIEVVLPLSPGDAARIAEALPSITRYVTADQVTKLASLLNNPLTRQFAINALAQHL